MRKRRDEHSNSMVVERDQSVIAIPIIEDGREVVHYAVEDDSGATASASDPLPESVHDALSLAGAWSDRDWNETIDALDRIRHESRPTAPIELQDL